ncbi:MAG: hypothetical protein J6586_11985, partial [Snodgrassella sp.]|nr:hypothetical protein [Snodgrassella sp.]
LYLQKKRDLLINGHSHQQVHALSVLILFSSGSAHIGVFYYSLIQPKLAFDRHMQFLRGGRVNKQHVSPQELSSGTSYR